MYRLAQMFTIFTRQNCTDEDQTFSIPIRNMAADKGHKRAPWRGTKATIISNLVIHTMCRKLFEEKMPAIKLVSINSELRILPRFTGT